MEILLSRVLWDYVPDRIISRGDDWQDLPDIEKYVPDTTWRRPGPRPGRPTHYYVWDAVKHWARYNALGGSYVANREPIKAELKELEVLYSNPNYVEECIEDQKDDLRYKRSQLRKAARKLGVAA